MSRRPAVAVDAGDAAPDLGRRRHHVTPTIAPDASAAAARSAGGSRVTLANGRPAAVSTTVTRIRRITQPGAAMTAPTTAGAPATTRTPPASAASPTAIAGATSGTMTTLTSGDRIASRPNDTRTIGSVAACAASDTPRLSASQPGIRPPPRRPSHSASGVAQAISPAVASDDSWKPASPISDGSLSSRSVAAQPSAAVARPARPDSRASSTTAAMSAARTTEADAPANATYATIARIVTTDRRRRPSRPVIAPIAAATMAMFQPEIATTWLTPAVVNAAARSRSTRSRRPIRIPAASPASGSGRTRVSASPAPRRRASRRRPGSSGVGWTVSVREDSVPTAPIRAR